MRRPLVFGRVLRTAQSCRSVFLVSKTFKRPRTRGAVEQHLAGFIRLVLMAGHRKLRNEPFLNQ